MVDKFDWSAARGVLGSACGEIVLGYSPIEFGCVSGIESLVSALEYIYCVHSLIIKILAYKKKLVPAG